MTGCYAAAIAARRSGVATLPISPATKKPTPGVGRWGDFQRRLPSEGELARWFRSSIVGMAATTGHVSGGMNGFGLECLDFDEFEVFWYWYEAVRRDAPNVFARLVWEMTPRGGFHVFYRAPTIAGNTKLAMRAETIVEIADRLAGLRTTKRPIGERDRSPRSVTMIETRGEGGYAVTAPTAGYTVRQGSLTTLPVLTGNERDLLHRHARARNEWLLPPPRTEGRRPPRERSEGAVLPGDDYNRWGDVLGLLERHGWRIARAVGEIVYLTRPGKEDGVSATWGYYPGYLIVFSTNAAPFEATGTGAPRGYDAFAVYTLLEHGGDFGAAARALARQGYGARDPTAAERLPVDPLTPRTLSPAAIAAVLTPRSHIKEEASHWLY